LIPDPRPKRVKVAPKVIVREPQAIGRRLGVIVISQFLAILGLSATLSSEYQSNQFMRDWFASYAWPLGYLLGNYLAPMLIGIIGTILILWRLVPARASANASLRKLCAGSFLPSRPAVTAVMILIYGTNSDRA